MTRGNQGTDHVWIVMMKAMRALTRYAAAGIEATGLGLSDFGVLEVLLHKGAHSDEADHAFQSDADHLRSEATQSSLSVEH